MNENGISQPTKKSIINAYSLYARRVGKKISQLTPAEKALALLNRIIELENELKEKAQDNK